MWLLHLNTPCAEYRLPICALGNLSSIGTGRVRDRVCPRDIRSCKLFTTAHYAGQALLGSHSLGGHLAAEWRGGGPDGGCDGQRGDASVLTKGMNAADRLAGDASAIPHWSPPTDRLVASATRVSVERRPEHRRIAGAARPGGVPAAVTEAGLVTDEDGSGRAVAIGASRGWVGDPSSGRGLHEVAEHPIKPRPRGNHPRSGLALGAVHH